MIYLAYSTSLGTYNNSRLKLKKDGQISSYNIGSSTFSSYVFVPSRLIGFSIFQKLHFFKRGELVINLIQRCLDFDFLYIVRFNRERGEEFERRMGLFVVQSLTGFKCFFLMNTRTYVSGFSCHSYVVKCFLM